MGRFVDDYSMLIDPHESPLFMTAFLNIIEDKCTTEKCYKNGKVFRSPAHVSTHRLSGKNIKNNCTQIEVIIDLVSRKITGAKIPEIDTRFAEYGRLAKDTRLWIRALRGDPVAEKKFLKLHFFTIAKILSKVEKLWEKNENYEVSWGGEKIVFFEFFHTLSWMIYALPHSELREKLRKILVLYHWFYDRENFLLAVLNGRIEFIKEDDIKQYVPREGFYWKNTSQKLKRYIGPHPIDLHILLNIYERRKNEKQTRA